MYDDLQKELIVTTDSYSKGMYILNTIIGFHNDILTEEEANKKIKEFEQSTNSEKNNYRFLQAVDADYNLKYNLSPLS